MHPAVYIQQRTPDQSVRPLPVFVALPLVALPLCAPVLHQFGPAGSRVNLCLADPLVLLGAIWLAWKFLHRGMKAPMASLFFATAAVIILSIVLNGDLSFSARAPLAVGIVLLKALFPWVYFFLVVNLIQSRRALELFVKAWIIGSGLVAGFGIFGAVAFHWAGVETPFAMGYRALGTMGDPNFFSMHLAVSLFLTLLYFLWSGRSAYWVWLLIAVDLAGIVLSASRSGLMAFLSATGILVLLATSVRFKITVLASVALASPLLVFVQFDELLEGNPFTERLSTVTVDVAATDRAQLWERGVRSFLMSPIYGIGYDNSPFLDPSPTGENPETHNTYLGLASDTGLAGLSVFLLAFLRMPFKLAARGWAAVRQLDSRTAWCVVAAFVNIGVLGVAVNVENYRGLWMLMGLAYAVEALCFSQHGRPDDILESEWSTATDRGQLLEGYLR